MQMTYAVCVQCGTEKSSPSVECSTCHFRPQSDDEKARSLILSLNYEIDGEYRGKNKEELEIIAKQIRAGKPYSFDEDEVRDVIAYAHRVLSIPFEKLFIDGL